MKKHVTIFALLSLLLVGCNGKTSDSSSSPAGNPSESEIQEVTERPAASATEKPRETAYATGGQESTSTSVSQSTSASSESLWGKEIAEDRKQHLGGYVIPYINIGKKKNLIYGFNDSTTKSSSLYKITGDDQFDGSRLANEFKPVFEQDGFTVTVDSENTLRTATKDSVHLSVKIEQDDSNFALKVSYDEPFDASQKTAWTSDEETEIKAELYGNTIPYVYLGSTNPYLDSTYGNKSLRVYGWNYDSSIRTAALAAFKSDDGWNAGKVNEDGKDKFTAVKTFTNCKLTVTIEKPNSNRRTYREITKDEIWNPDTAAGKWDDDVLSEIHSEADNHDIPYLYLGTRNPTREYKPDYRRFVFTGGFWNDAVLDLAEKTFKDANWTVNRYTGSYGVGIQATILEDDGCRLTRGREVPYDAERSGKIVRNVTYSGKAQEHADATGWDEDTKSSREKHFNGHVIPYFFIGAKDTRASFSYSSSSINIYPTLSGTYNVQMLYDAESALNADGYSVTKKYYSDKGTFDLSASKTFEDGDTLVVTRNANNTKVSLAGTASVTVNYYEKYSKPENGSWADGMDISNESTTTEASRKTNFGAGYTLPYIYLGAKHCYSKWDENSRTRTINGGRWNNDIPVSLKSTLDSDTANGTWGEAAESTDSTNKYTYTRTKTFKDGATRKITLKQPASDTEKEPFHPTVLEVVFSSAYGSSETAWSKKISDAMTSSLGGYTIPYVYLHAECSKLKVIKRASSGDVAGNVKLTGGLWDDRVLTDAVPVFEKDGFTVSTSVKRNGHICIEGYKINKDNSYLRVLLYKDGPSNTSKAALNIYYDPALSITDTSTDWSNDIKQKISGKFYNDIPYFYSGDYVKASYSDKKANALSYGYVSTNTSKQEDGKYHDLFNNIHLVLNAKSAFEKEGWTTTIDWFNSVTNGSDGYASFIAEKINANGSRTRAQVIAQPSALTRKVYSYDAYQKPEADNQKWNDNDLSKIKDALYGNVAPFVYLGTDDPIVTSNSTSGHTIQITGGLWNDQVLTDAESTFKNDKTIAWNYLYSYATISSETAKVLHATGEAANADGTKTYWIYKISPKKEGFSKVVLLDIQCFII